MGCIELTGDGDVSELFLGCDASASSLNGLSLTFSLELIKYTKDNKIAIAAIVYNPFFDVNIRLGEDMLASIIKQSFAFTIKQTSSVRAGLIMNIKDKFG